LPAARKPRPIHAFAAHLMPCPGQFPQNVINPNLAPHVQGPGEGWGEH